MCGEMSRKVRIPRVHVDGIFYWWERVGSFQKGWLRLGHSRVGMYSEMREEPSCLPIYWSSSARASGSTLGTRHIHIHHHSWKAKRPGWWRELNSTTRGMVEGARGVTREEDLKEQENVLQMLEGYAVPLLDRYALQVPPSPPISSILAHGSQRENTFTYW